MRVFLAILSLAGLAASVKVSYDGYKVFEIVPEDREQVKLLSTLQRTPEYDFWLRPRAPNKRILVMVPPERIQQLEEFLRENGIRSRVQTENVKDSIHADETYRAKPGDSMGWDSFHPLETIYKWLEAVAKKYKNVQTVVGGTTYENRVIKGIEINFGKNLTGVVILSGIHGREWLAPAGTSWFISRILKSTRNSVFRQFNYLYFPVFNPDSYVFSWTTDRYWAKTRKPYAARGRTYYGADPDRNFKCHWRENGAAEFDDYAGPFPFSEIETKSMSRYLKSVARKRKNDIYLIFQTIDKTLAYPWGWTKKKPKQEKFWKTVGLSAAKAWTEVDGSFIVVETFAEEELVPIHGNCLDWCYTQFNCTFPFLYKMRSDDFVVDPWLIKTTGREHLASLKQLLIEYQNVKPNT